MTVYRHVLVIASVVTMGLTGASAAASAQTAPRPRIVNGALSHRPTVGALLTVRPGGFSGSCSGTMIGCQTFLTAAHCVCDGLDFSSCGAIDPSDYKVFLQNVGIVDVSAIDADPTYDFAQGGDIAVVTLASPIEGVSPMTIHTGSSPAPGTAAQIAGYGITADGRDDSGVLRDGDVETSSCSGIAEPSTHLCWVFAEPFGVPGSNSNTCQGDSGGPLFADLGAGDRLVGVTSGGDVCVGGVSFDADVSAHSAFITGIAGADLLNTTCGSIAQVGTPGATVTPISYTDIANTKAQRSCRKTIGTAIRTLTSSTLMAQQKCLDGVNRGLLAGPCPDTKASDAILRALAKVTADKLGKKCPADLLAAGVGQEALCTGATAPGSLSTCIANTAATQSDAAVALHYAEDAPSGPIADAGVLACQNGIAKAGLSLLKARLTAESSCAAALDAGKVPTCPDAKASVKLQRAEAKATDTIGGACSDAQIVALDAAGDFGTCGSVTTVAGLVSCLLAGDADISAGTLDVLSLAQLTADATFDVPVGTDLLRITLNGDETAPNDLDLYVRAGGPATPTTYDHASQNAGMWETIEVVSPAAGTWHMHVDLFSGAPSITYQVTATTFEP